MAWFKVMDKLPEVSKMRLCYSEVYGVYVLANFHPARGWHDVDGDSIKSVTDWNDMELDLPFQVRHKFDEEIAQNYGFQKKTSSPSSSAERLAKLLESTS